MSTVATEPWDVPTFSECVIGYRSWIADARDQLWPLHTARRPWLPGINIARCDSQIRVAGVLIGPAPGHVAPDAACHCGLYSWRRPQGAWHNEPLWVATRRVFGAVASWGHIQVHATGFRAEYACIVVLGYHPRTPPDAVVTLERIAARYRVELVPLEYLVQAASRHGAPLPETLRPVSPPTNADEPDNFETEGTSEATPLSQQRSGEHSLAQQPSPHGATHPPVGVPKPAKKLGQAVLIGLLGLVALLIGLLAIWHPVVLPWTPGQAHTAEVPPVFGAGLLAIPIVIIGFAVRDVVVALELDFEAWRQWRRHRRIRQ